MKRTRIIIAALGVLLIAGVAYLAYKHRPPVLTSSVPERKVADNVVTSMHDPVVSLAFDKSFKYLAGQRFILERIAIAEQHFFVLADDRKHIKQLYWVQFEGYLPTNAMKHDYRAEPFKFERAGLTWLADTWAEATSTDAKRADSDSYHYRETLKAAGYTLPAEQMGIRMVALDPSLRNELMIIYLEDLEPSGYKAADFKEGGKAHEKWPFLERALIDRATAGFKAAPASHSTW